MIRHLPSVITIISFAFFASTPLLSQETLVKDINTDPAGFRQTNDYTELFCKCGDYLFFAVPGKELWRTDGTSDGTISLGDINKGFIQGFSGGMACVNNTTLLFQAADGQHGWELWTSDGTKAGTRMVKDITPNNNVSWGNFIPLGLIGNTYYFLTDHNYDKNLELWKSDGTENTTVMVPDFPVFTSVFPVGKSDTHIFFRTTNSSTSENELWATDGTGTNTIKVLDGYFAGFNQNMGTHLMFAANNPANNSYSLWSSNGTDIGTYKVKDFGFSYLQRLNRFNDKLIFGVYSDTWISDGTEAGTTFLTTGAADGSITIGTDFYSLGYDFSTGFYRLFKTDGTMVETYNMLDPADLGALAMFHQIPVLGNKLYLQYFEESLGQELAAFNLDSKNFDVIKDINPGPGGSVPRAWARLHDKIYFLADDGSHGTEIWSTDGSADGTSMLKHIMTENGNAFRSVYFSPVELVAADNKLQLLVEPQANKLAIYSSDGTQEGTLQKFEFPTSGGTLFGQVNNELIYFSDRKFFKTSGSTNDVTLFKDITNDVGGLGYYVTTYPAVGGKLIFRFATYSGNFTYGGEFWVTDGTDAGTHLLKDINPGIEDGVSSESALLGSKLIFQGIEPATGPELWTTDGTESGTVLLKDINPGAMGSTPNGFAVLGDKVVFGATDNQYGAEVWVTDGTSEGTKLLVDIIPGTIGSEARHFRAGLNCVYFSAYDSEKGWTLWKTNGTPEGTQMVADVIPDNAKTKFTTNLAAVGDKFYFGANDEVHGQELWVTDGTEAGTHVIDVITGSSSSNPSQVVDINGVAYFKADASLWRTNGLQQGTFRVSNLEPFNWVLLNNWVYFSAFHPDHGVELFKVEFTKVDQQIVLEDIPEKIFGDAPFPVQASATSGLPVCITSGDELTILNGTATIVKPGTVTITIRQKGDALFNAAEPVEHTFCILPPKPTIMVSGLNIGEPVLTSSANEGNQWFENNQEIPGATEKTYTPEASCTFKVRVTTDGCTSEFSNDEVILITGIEDVADLVTFYPNPAQEYLKIQATGNTATIQVDIIDFQGKPVEAFHVQPNGLVDHSLRGYVPGIYLLKVLTPNGTSYHKFVKE